MTKELELATEMLVHNQNETGITNEYLSNKVEWMKMAIEAIKRGGLDESESNG